MYVAVLRLAVITADSMCELDLTQIFSLLLLEMKVFCSGCSQRC